MDRPELTPGFTEYRDRLQVQTYDVTGLLAPGRNAIGAIVSDGWFRGQVGLPRAHDQWGSELGLLAQMRLDCADGATAVVGTGPGWRSARSHIEAADLIAGQSTDLRGRADGWSEPGFDDGDWDPVGIVDGDYAGLVASPAPPVRAIDEVAPVSARRVARGQVFDLGQNINGWVRLRNLGPAGTALTLTHGEALDASGDVTTEQLDVSLPFLAEPLPAGQVDRVVSAGRAGEVFEPRHTTHGFRYVRVEGHPDSLGMRDLTGVVVHTDMARTGWFRCSDDRINGLHDAAVMSLRGNACDIPTDEVIGRGADATRYGELAARVRAAWQAEFIGDGRLIPDTQANQVRALAFDLVPAGLRAAVAVRLVELIRAAGTHLATGFLATPYLLPVLADTGHAAVAYEPYGRIGSAWRLDGDQLELTATVPPGSTAEIVLPDGSRRTVEAGRHVLRAEVHFTPSPR